MRTELSITTGNRTQVYVGRVCFVNLFINNKRQIGTFIMPLPVVLLAKLSKRGLLTEAAAATTEKDIYNDYKGSACCPNKNNIYHECTVWCQIHWKGVLTPDNRYARNFRKLMEKYPLPGNWTEVYDKGIGRYYYWNMESNQVSWLPPKHPKCVPVDCAAKQRMQLHAVESEQPLIDRDSEKRRDKGRHYRDRRDCDDDRKHKYDDRERSRKKPRNDDVDPMDPSAYSDVPRGTWSDGLEQNKSKADPTASGVLYQQRPYPSPGEVLSSNKQKFKNLTFLL